MLLTFSRRGRRRLRQLELESQTMLRIDRRRQVLEVRGTPEGSLDRRLGMIDIDVILL